MTIIPVSGGAFAAYDVVVGRGLLAQAGAHIAPLAKGRTVIVTDETVAGLHAQTLIASLTAAGVTSEIVAVPAGEGSKSFAELERVLDRLLEIGLDRKDVVIALGGGVVGDRLRRDVQAALDGKRPVPKLSEPGGQPTAPPAQAMELTATVTAPTLNLRKVAGGAIVGSLPRGTRVAVLDHDRGWSEVRTPGGYLGFVASQYLTLDA